MYGGIRTWNIISAFTSYRWVGIWCRCNFIIAGVILAVQIGGIIMRIVVYRPGKFLKNLFRVLFGIKKEQIT